MSTRAGLISLTSSTTPINMAANETPKSSVGSRPSLFRATSSTQGAGAASNDPLQPPRRAQTFHNGAAVVAPLSKAPPPAEIERPDAFETGQDADEDEDDGIDPGRGSVDLDDLPIELVSLTDSFVDALTSKVHKTPPSIDNVAQLFQDFYLSASSHVNTHISALATRQSRANSPAPPSKLTPAGRLRAKAASIGSKDKPQNIPKPETERQMITAEELAEKKKARKALEAKRAMLEEAVERRLCEGLYNRIYRHRSTQDQAQDDKLRSKTAALALVGIGPADLGIDLGEDTTATPAAAVQRAEEIRGWLEQARTDLIRMHEKRYPLGKLNHLKAAHKSIVDTLGAFPSNFRWEPKLTGRKPHTALTNLEAAISFLETVDLSTLRADELPQGPPKDGMPGISRADTFPPAFPPGLTITADGAAEGTVETDTSNAAALRPPPSPSASSGLRAVVQARNRRLSELVNTPAQAFGAASDAVFKSADQGLNNITNSLGDSYKFLLGKLRETQGAPTATGEALVVPRTLDDARKLVSTPPPDEDGSVSGASSVHGADERETAHKPPPSDDKVMSLIGGKKAAARDHSADSARSASSSKKVLFAQEKHAAAPSPLPTSSANPLENAVRNFGNSFNPMGQALEHGVMRGFGRVASSPVAPTLKDPQTKPAEGGDLSAAFPDIAPALPPKQVSKVKPPNKRFMELQNPGDLKLGEVLELLRDYRRLADALKERDAFDGAK
ncbi:conserved hypothetical protein [Verticillium alfalfae VaMs.102]|uniref:VPS9 domain-containing protein n=1 Tax=Verticillium alfalfae (strain VaMs.102 / ATCC MYA-4576 / FGSC 10136) TaxID=526221 RepID=C9SCA1_VERA1|nr:conserved hypothetical protein [Verticillium alfalfae VaMs.102]EEY16716.1 conserved hypothetical protein [Verticillium alfalfae VaMs.102]